MTTAILLSSITATPTLSDGGSSTAAADKIQLKLDDAVLGHVMKPPAYRKATCSLNVDFMDRIPPGNLVSVLTTINVGKFSSQSRRLFLSKRIKETRCYLQIIVNNTIIYDNSLFTTDGDFKNITSSKVEASKYLVLKMIQECEERPVELVIASAIIENKGSNAQLPGATATDAQPSNPTTTDYADGGKNPF
ncbi:hypothetical protein BFJ63_vAg17319 [Fusarium oxysporum f. sp. narcissi]|uniref:Uncharacterized protein n=1 Tax=Fusarium oxysporum f. sp. narcissi TaxID=451672 RepID=A0A4Q2V794_FUSOX|nr:hypothetical protein BFJ70_g1199 [Fusarium oxysporum]RYC79797.1 hypothetical protein BFJ63_vAg17319 [Fusarium oxysporum f. sp. narcissi]